MEEGGDGGLGRYNQYEARMEIFAVREKTYHRIKTILSILKLGQIELCNKTNGIFKWKLNFSL